MEHIFDLFLQSLIARTFKKTYHIDNVVVQVGIDKVGMINFKARTFNDDYSNVATYEGYVQRDASEILVTRVNEKYLTKMVETSNETRYVHNFIHLSI